LSSIWPVKKKHQLPGSSDGTLLVGGITDPIYAHTTICESLDAMEVGGYPCDMLLKVPWPPPVLLNLIHAGAILHLTQFDPNSIPKLVEGLILWFSVQLKNRMNISPSTISAAWGQAAFQGEGNVSYRAA
jgi:hypothetical protein